MKEPSKPSTLPISPTLPSSRDKTLDSIKEITNSTEILKADSTYENAININEKIGFENSKEALVIEPSIPSAPPILPATPSSMDENIENVINISSAELLKADSTYEHTIDIDEEIGLRIMIKKLLLDEEIPSLTPLRSQVIKVKKAVKAEFKD